MVGPFHFGGLPSQRTITVFFVVFECSLLSAGQFRKNVINGLTEPLLLYFDIGATNRPQELDEAARRRLTKRLYIPLPSAGDFFPFFP